MALPGGRKIAAVEALCSDRGLYAGDIKIIDADSGVVNEIDVGYVDATHISWKSEHCLFFASLQDLKTVAGGKDMVSGKVTTLWRTSDGCGRLYPSATLLPSGSFIVALQSWTKYPELAIAKDGKSNTLVSFSHKGHTKDTQGSNASSIP